MPCGVAVQVVADFAVDDAHEADRRDADREQQHVQKRAERPRAQVAPRELEDVHAAAFATRRGSASWRAMRAFKPRIVRRDNKRDVLAARGAEQKIGDRGRGLVVEIRGRLVGEQELGSVDERARDRDALLLAN